MNIPERPITILIAALGGEGGGVMADWLMEAATASRLSRAGHLDPGRGAAHRRHDLLPRDLSVAARTSWAAGSRCSRSRRAPATSTSWSPPSWSRPGARCTNGFVSPERTTLIASTHRIYATVEKMQMADGRFDSDRVVDGGQAARASARCCSTCASSRRRAAP